MHNWICIANNIEVPLESTRIEFDHDAEYVNTILTVELNTKEGDRGFTKFPLELFDIFPHMNSVTIQSNVEKLSPTDWTSAKYLRQLKLGHNQFLTSIPRTLFAGLDNLRILELRYNRIETIEDGAFHGRRLWVIDLSYNKLTTLSDLVFSNVPNLQIINIHHNELIHIGRSIFHAKNASWIDLSYNHIADIDLIEFSKFRKLDSLMLDSSGFSFDSIEGVGNERNNTCLHSLNICTNNLTNIFDLRKLGMFKGLKDLAILNNPFSNYDQLSAAYIKGILPNLQRLVWDGVGLKCEKYNEMIIQMKLSNITTVNYGCRYPPCLTCTN